MDDHADHVWRFLVGCVGHADAEDCFQETFLAALRAYPELRNAGNLRGWVLRIAQSKAMDAHRGRARRPRAVADVPERGAPASTESDEVVWALVRELPDKQRAAIAHRFANDLPYREIARVMSCSEDAARRNVHEGIRKLREAMGA
jgi:RNA polymerase sigma factor (sigma-70 family)